MLKLLSVGGFLMALFLVTGCGPTAVPKAKVSGEVNLDGKPLADGEIAFVKPGDPPDVMKVTNGKFDGEATIGDKSVEIRAYKEGKVSPTATIKEATKENFIPAKYNATTTLKASVSATGVSPSKFDVKSD